MPEKTNVAQAITNVTQAITENQEVTQETINKTATRELYGGQKSPLKLLSEKPFLEEIGFAWIPIFFKALGNVLFIVPVLILGIMEAISAGFLAGMKKVTISYERHLEKE